MGAMALLSIGSTQRFLFYVDIIKNIFREDIEDDDAIPVKARPTRNFNDPKPVVPDDADSS